MTIETDPFISRRTLLSAALVMAGAAVTGCTKSVNPVTDTLHEAALSVDHQAIINSVPYKTRAVTPSNDALFRAVTASLFLRDANHTYVGSAFVYNDADGQPRIGTVEHALLGEPASELRAAGMFVAGMTTKLMPLPLPLTYTRIGNARNDSMVQLTMPQNVDDQIGGLVQDGIIRPVSLAPQPPAVGDVVLLPQLNSGAFERIIVGGHMSDESGETRVITVQERVLDALNADVPGDIAALTDLEQRIMSGEGNVAQDLGSFVCSGDSGTPLLTEATQQVCGVVQGLAISIKNSIGQFCGPLVYIS